LKIENKAKQQLDQELICRHIVRMLAIPWKKRRAIWRIRIFLIIQERQMKVVWHSGTIKMAK